MTDWQGILGTLIDAFGPAGGVVIAAVSFAWWSERKERKEIAREIWTALLSQSETNSAVASSLRELANEIRRPK